jgi:DNA polymerase
MLAYAFDDGPVCVWCPHLGPMPDELAAALVDPEVIKSSWNVNFEFNILTSKLGLKLDIAQWFDPAAHARALGYPANLADCGDVLKIDTAHEKSANGKALIKLFSEPTKAKKPTKKNPAGVSSVFNNWETHPTEWAEFVEYCRQDVIAERAIGFSLNALCPFQPQERVVWVVDQQINARGIPIDLSFCDKAMAYAENAREALLFDMRSITGCENPNSPEQLKAWLADKGYPYAGLGKEFVEEALKNPNIQLTDAARSLLLLKQELGGIAFKKLPVIKAWTREDRLRYAFLYHAAHTGRWSSKGAQFHNLKKPTKRVGDSYFEIVSAIDGGLPIPGDIPTVEAVAGTLRAAVRARPGNTLYVADYSSVENRVLAWFACCPGMLDVFKGFDAEGKPLDPYKAFAALYYKIPYEQVTKEQRNFCKSPVLGCGYGMGPGRLVAYAAQMGQTITEEEAYGLVHGWRDAYPQVPAYWDIIGNAAIRAVKYQEHLQVGPLRFDGRNPAMFFITLPSGRQLHYSDPKIGKSKFYQDVVTFMSTDTKLGWSRQEARGSFLVENIVQATSRDLLVNGMFECIKAGFALVLHVHDELVAEVVIGSPLTYHMFETCLTKNPETWGQDIPLKVDGYEGLIYKKG